MNNQTQDTDLGTVERNYWTDQYAALEALKDNKDFITLITEGYFKDKAINLTSLLATDYTRRSGTRGSIMEELVSISGLENHFSVIRSLGAPTVEEDEDFEYEDL